MSAWIGVGDRLPGSSTSEPIFLKRKGEFKYGLTYKQLNEDRKKVWRISPEVTHWMEPPGVVEAEVDPVQELREEGRL